MSADQTQEVRDSGLSISRKQRNLLFERLARSLSRIDDLHLAIATDELEKGERFARDLHDDLTLLIMDLGWGEPRELTIELSTPAPVLRRVLERLRAEAECLDAGIDLRDPATENRELAATCDQLLQSIEAQHPEDARADAFAPPREPAEEAHEPPLGSRSTSSRTNDRGLPAADALSLEVTGDAARVVFPGRPEIIASLDGLQFNPGEEALVALLRASIVSLARQIQEDLHEEEEIFTSVHEVQARARRIWLAARAMQWELRDRPTGDAWRSDAYRAEVLELLHGPPPLIELTPEEREALVRIVTASLKREQKGDPSDWEIERGELEILLEDVGLLKKCDFPYLVTRVRARRLLEWLFRWKAELRHSGEDALADLAAVRSICDRLERRWTNHDETAAAAGPSVVFPREVR
jgi:hypothetical protein